MEYAIKTRSKYLKQFIESIMPSMIDQLKLNSAKKFVLIEISSAAGEGNDGITLPLPELDSYVIALKPAKWYELGVTLAHEMIHVKQLAKGVLRSEKGKRLWRGKRFSKNIHYLDSPWEIEAFSKQELVFRRALENKSH